MPSASRPRALVYFRLLATGDYADLQTIAVLAASGLYVLALAVRLARFNITTGGESVFQGVPGTLAAPSSPPATSPGTTTGLHEAVLVYSPAYLVLFAALMVSSLKVPKLAIRKNKALNVFQLVNIAAAYVLGPLRLFPSTSSPSPSATSSAASPSACSVRLRASASRAPRSSPPETIRLTAGRRTR